MREYIIISALASLAGISIRLIMLRSDYRQYPSSPHSLISHIAMAAIASVLGAVATPAFLEKEYTAVTFLALAATQFREIRSVERESLQSLEETELVQRGQAYIEDTAKKFESRNYVAMMTAFCFSAFYYIIHIYLSAQLSIVLSLMITAFIDGMVYIYMRGGEIADIADIYIKKVKHNGPLVTVDDVVLINVGNKKSLEIILKNANGILLKPRNKDAAVTLANLGQRQAILNNCATILGIRKDIDEPDFTPIARRQPENGDIAILIICMEDDRNVLIDAIAKTPILESAKRKPSAFYKRLNSEGKTNNGARKK